MTPGRGNQHKSRLGSMRVLDLFCGAGGAAMGLHRAWPDAEIVGVDIHRQPSYPFKFVQADAMLYPLEGFYFIWASPPCQAYSKTRKITGKTYPELVGPTRERLEASGIPYVIENVPGARLRNPIMLCGTMFGLRVIRHRHFESSFLMLQPPDGRHGGTNSHRGYSTGAEFVCVAGHNYIRTEGAEAMGIDWMRTRDELSEAVPPAYSEFIAKQWELYR